MSCGFPMPSILLLLSLLLFCQIVQDLACQGGGGGGKKAGKGVWDKYRGKRLKDEPREHWKIPDNLKEKYGDWLVSYKINQTLLAKLERNSTLPPGMVVPEAWKGYGAGYTGQAPPPWAMIEGMQGKPTYCFEEPDPGECYERMRSWGYNSYINECLEFSYSGCGGNFNNFRSKAQCEEVCIHPSETKCQKNEEYPHYDMNDTTYKNIPI